MLALGVVAPSVLACSCVRQHPAMFLPDAEAAIVGVVESRQTTNSTVSHVIRVERAIKGTFGERVTVESGFTSCQVSLEPGTRVGLFLSAGSLGEWTASACGVTDPDALLAAADLPAPRGPVRLVAAVDANSTDAVALGSGGRLAGYVPRDGKALAIAPCGSGVVQAVRRADGTVHVSSRFLPQLSPSAAYDLPWRDVAALGCTDGGRTVWAAGRSGDEVELLSMRSGQAPRREMRRPARGVAIIGSKAYFAHEDRVRRVPLTGPRVLRSTPHEGPRPRPRLGTPVKRVPSSP